MTNCSTLGKHHRHEVWGKCWRRVRTDVLALHLYQQIPARLDQSCPRIWELVAWECLVSENIWVGTLEILKWNWAENSEAGMRYEPEEAGEYCPRVWVLWQLSKVRRGRPMWMRCWLIGISIQPTYANIRIKFQKGPAEFHSRILLGLHYQ